jgi:protein-tyrosine phosphatase
VTGFVDVHTHVLPGVDDGTRTLEEAVATAAEAAAGGVEAMVATPHVRDDYPTSADMIADGVAALRRELGDRGIPLALHPGAEVALERVAAIDPAELRRYSLAGGPYILVEFPYRGWPAGAEAVAATLLRSGFTPLLAHPERNDAIAERPERLRPLVEAGCFVQVTSGSVTGGLGRTPRRAAEALLELGLVHVVATDLHGPSLERAGLAAAFDALGANALARTLVSAAPRAVLEGAPLPSVPAARKNPWWKRPRRR